LHRLLKRQLKRVWGENLPEDRSLQRFVELIEKTYESFDIEKRLLENTVSINTEELKALNKKIEIDGELRLKGLIEQAPYGFIIFSKTGNIFDVNKFACEVLGYDKSEFLALQGDDIFGSFTKIKFQKILQKVIENDEKLSCDEIFQNFNGNLIPVEITAGKLLIKDEPHILIMFQDIIERVQTERIAAQKQREIEELNKNLEERVQEEVVKNFEKDQLLIQQSKMAAMGDMMGNIAHQWRQPLNTLAIAIQDVEEAFIFDEINEDYIKDFIATSMENINFMSKTIDDFRNFFKPSKTREKFKLRDAIEDILQIVTAQLKNNNIEISLTGENYEVIGYPNEFKQVILNLTNNAKDAIIDNNIENGKIEITTSTYSTEFKEVQIIDNGGGIPQHIIEKIFEPYFTTKEGNKGTGIGLYMSKTIIEENMKGKLTVENRNGGAVFSLKIPCVCHLNGFLLNN
jgi:PAS domain S-box-containing protein